MKSLYVPKQYQDLYAKARSGRIRKAAIRCHCLMCCGWQPGEVRQCTAPNCPLYPYRMLGSADKAAETAQEATIAAGS